MRAMRHVRSALIVVECPPPPPPSLAHACLRRYCVPGSQDTIPVCAPQLSQVCGALLTLEVAHELLYPKPYTR